MVIYNFNYWDEEMFNWKFRKQKYNFGYLIVNAF